MAFDLMVGQSGKHGGKQVGLSVRVGELDYHELPQLHALAGRASSFFLDRMLDLYKNQSFGVEELGPAQAHLLALLPQTLSPGERVLLHKLIAAVAYALAAEQPLHGVAD